MNERATYDTFRMVALRLPNADVKELLKSITWIELPEPRLDPVSALAIIKAFYPGERRPNPATARDIFVSCSWQPDDRGSALTVCRALVEQGFRLIGDDRDQRGFGTGDRVARIIASCGAFVGIIPYRGISTSDSDNPYKHFFIEMDIAARLNVPSIVIADPRVSRLDRSDGSWLRMDTAATQCPPEIESRLNGLWEQWRPPSSPQYVFCAMNMDSEMMRADAPIRQIIERITGMATFVGSDIRDNNVQAGIIQKLKDAFVVFADITDDNLNTCIEAGIGVATGTNVELVSQGPPRRPPFMLRTLQMPTYKDAVDQLALIHKIFRPYRRRIINAEL